MQELLELSGIVTPQKLKAAGNFDLLQTRHPREMELFLLITRAGIRTDKDAAQKLFPKKEDTAAYTVIKDKLKDLLVEQLFQIELNLPAYNSRQRAYFECYKKWSAIKLLMGKNAWANTLALAEGLLKKAQRFEFAEIVLDLVRTMRLYYGSIAGILKKYEEYSAQEAIWEETFRYENIAEGLYTDLVARFVNNKAAQQEVHEKAIEYYEQLYPALQQYETYRLHLSGRLIQNIIYTSINDYQKTIEVCASAIRFFEAKHYPAKIPLQIFLYQEMVCYVQLKDYQKGKIAAERGLRLLDEGAFNWFKYQELLVFLAFHTRQYQDAYHVFKHTTRHRRFGSLPSAVTEIWRIIEAYLFYLIELQKVKSEPGDTEFSRFRMARFVNETPIFFKDKRGMNIPILIFQILSLILNRRYDVVIDRIEAIEKYCSRYLRRDDTFRSNCFIKMLLVIPSKSFHKAAVVRHTEKYFKMLQSMPLDMARQSHDVELIPYEDLWDMILATLSDNFYRAKK